MTATVEATRVTADEVKERLARGEPITFVDVRNPKAWGESPVKLPGAIRLELDRFDEQADDIPRDRAIVTYCT